MACTCFIHMSDDSPMAKSQQSEVELRLCVTQQQHDPTFVTATPTSSTNRKTWKITMPTFEELPEFYVGMPDFRVLTNDFMQCWDFDPYHCTVSEHPALGKDGHHTYSLENVSMMLHYDKPSDPMLWDSALGGRIKTTSAYTELTPQCQPSRLRHIIGREGRHFIRITKMSRCDYIVYDEKRHVIQIYGNEDNIQKAVNLLKDHVAHILKYIIDKNASEDDLTSEERDYIASRNA